MEDIESIRSTRSNRLMNIVNKLKKKVPKVLDDIELEPLDTFEIPRPEAEEKHNLPENPLYFEEKRDIEPVDKSDSFLVESLRSLNYSPPGYQVWNHYYEDPNQKYPNSLKINLKSGEYLDSFDYQIIGFLIKDGINLYKVLYEDNVRLVNEHMIYLMDPKIQTRIEEIYQDNLLFHKENLPSKDLTRLDYLLYGKNIEYLSIDSKEKVLIDTPLEEDLESKVSSTYDLDLGNTLVLPVIKSLDLFYNKFRYRRWKIYAQNYDSSLLEYYGSILVDKKIDSQYSEGYIRFGWGKMNGKATLVPIENVDYNPMISIGYHRQIDYLKTTIPKKIKQMGGGEDAVGKKIPLDDSGVEVPMNLLKSIINDGTKLYEIYKYYQPFPNRIFNGALKLKIETSLDEPSINIDSILGTWTFADIENYGGFIYKKDITNELNEDFAIIKVCYKTPLQNMEEVPEIFVQHDLYGDVDANEFGYWFICKNNTDIDSWKPLFYSPVLNNVISSIPLVKDWYDINLFKVNIGDENTPVSVSVKEDIEDSEKMINTAKNSRFLLFPWELDLSNHNEELKLNINSWVRIIKDFEYNGFNLRYFIGKVVAINENQDKNMVYSIKMEFPFPVDSNIDNIELLESFIEVLDYDNSILKYYKYLEENKSILTKTKIEDSRHYKKRMENRVSANLSYSHVDNFLLENSTYKVYDYYLQSMVLSKDSQFSPFIIDISKQQIKLGYHLNHEFIDIDPFCKPSVKKHILEKIIDYCKKICLTKDLTNMYNCTISNNWPPKIGDKVYIMEGLYKGEVAKINDIIIDLNHGNNGEALVNILGDFEKTKTKSKKPWYVKPNNKKKGGNNVVNYKISMNYLLPYHEDENEEVSENNLNKKLGYPGSMLLTMTFNETSSNSEEFVECVHNDVDTINYKISYNKMGIELKNGEYFEITKGEYKGFIATLLLNDRNGVEFMEKKPKIEYRDSERAGEEIIMKNSEEGIVRLGVQPIITVKLAKDLYHTMDDLGSDIKSFVDKISDNPIKLIYSTNSLISETKKLNGGRSLAIERIMENSKLKLVGGSKNPLMELSVLLGNKYNKVSKNINVRKVRKRKTLF